MYIYIYIYIYDMIYVWIYNTIVYQIWLGQALVSGTAPERIFVCLSLCSSTTTHPN